jgi:hypothetical protein
MKDSFITPKTWFGSFDIFIRVNAICARRELETLVGSTNSIALIGDIPTASGIGLIFTGRAGPVVSGSWKSNINCWTKGILALL